MDYFLAIDIGASSGRHILASIKEEKLILEEVYRFENHVNFIDGHYCWDVDYLFQSILNGIKECVKMNKIPRTLGIDTWAVDYVLLDQNKNRLTPTYAYRDKRNDIGVEKIGKILSKDELYRRTGIQFQKFNTLYQLNAYQDNVLDQATDYLMIPDFLNYLLTGLKINEYTNMSTTQLLNIKTNNLDGNILKQAKIPSLIFQKLVMPGYSLGYFKKDIQKLLGCNIEVIVPATHDTGSAYMSAIEEDSIIISSGTWSLLGIETKDPIVTEQSMQANFTNEGGYDYHYRFLKNIMGLWIIQEVAREYKGIHSFQELVSLARNDPFDGVFDVNDERFLKPKNMVKEILDYFSERKQSVPLSTGQIAYCVYNSLAYSYKEAIDELESITQKTYPIINIIGGGCQNELLNELIANITGKTVIAGPVEATALGNILCQLISLGIIENLSQGRQLIKNSFDIIEYKGENHE